MVYVLSYVGRDILRSMRSKREMRDVERDWEVRDKRRETSCNLSSHAIRKGEKSRLDREDGCVLCSAVSTHDMHAAVSCWLQVFS